MVFEVSAFSVRVRKCVCVSLCLRTEVPCFGTQVWGSVANKICFVVFARETQKMTSKRSQEGQKNN